MRHRTYLKGGYDRGGITEQGGEPSGQVHLYRDPQSQREAATKRYVDSKANGLSGLAFTRGTLNHDRIPAYSGDVVKNAGSPGMSLNVSNVLPGSYTKIRVDTQGRVTEGFFLSAFDIPGVSWDMVKNNAPTTITGFGITDCLTSAGGNFNGHLTIPEIPTTEPEMASKAYVDMKATNSARVGDIMLSMHSVTPANYLKCNGGMVSKEMYSTLYGEVGDSFNPPTGTPPDKFCLPDKYSGLLDANYYIRY